MPGRKTPSISFEVVSSPQCVQLGCDSCLSRFGFGFINLCAHKEPILDGDPQPVAFSGPMRKSLAIDDQPPLIVAHK